MHDIILVTGDRYWDHPMNGTAIIRRLLEAKGYKVGVIDQPDWKDSKSFSKYGKPRLFFAVSSGCMDSMLANYTPMKKRREGSWMPDRAVIVYCNKIRELYKDTPLVIAGVEASARRLSHYDYWDNKVRRSIILDARADIIAYGMAERQILEIARRIEKSQSLEGIRGTVTVGRSADNALLLPGYPDVIDKRLFAKSFLIQHANRDAFTAKRLAEPNQGRFVIQEPPALPLTTEELDFIYSFPFTRELPDEYKKDQMMQAIQFSIVTHRGCFGGCSFCSIGFLQGKRIQSRSRESILGEARRLSRMKGWKGIIYDVGGPTANMYAMGCNLTKGSVRYNSIIDGKEREMAAGISCVKDCLPGPCKNLDKSNSRLTNLLRELRTLAGVRKVFVRSGTRTDIMDNGLLREIAEHHVSGQLKVAPEHVNPQVLKLMNKPGIKEFEEFKKRFERLNAELGKKQFLLPYLIAAHPGCGMREARELADYIKRNRIAIEQVQVFTPTPMTLSTCMYYTGADPFTGKRIHVPYSYAEKKEQKRLLVGNSKG